ncbi:hypothetical protein VP01_110g9 [Puccinia sorghi]|uniref:Uncharacterized protein n=1 Tax=Puccinia sorghi TaxID=27349 RepID=A0A0L6VU40_9BASI|nr:hypothetical protein VP01_110g9 [Puccinia sorghi]
MVGCLWSLLVCYSIPSLSNTTFATWKTQVLAYCMEYNLDNFLLRDLAPPPPSEAEKLEVFESRRGKAAGILVRCMGQTNNNKFVNDTNRRNPRKLWMLLTDHYESKAADNQAKVYQTFCNFKFTKDLSTFFDNLNAHLASMTSVGLKVGIPDKIHIHEHLLAEQIIQKLPESLSHFKDTLFAKRPLTLDIVKEHLQAKIPDSSAINFHESISVKTESALAASKVYCSNGTHNPATNHPESKCWQLHPEQKRPPRKSSKKQAKAAVTGEDSDNTDGKSLKVEGSGYVHLNDGHGSSIKIKAIHVPRIAQPLISSGRLFCKGCVVQKSDPSDLNSSKFVVMDLHSDSLSR